MRKHFLLISLAGMLPIACSSELGPDDYSAHDTGGLAARFVMGTISEVRQVKVQRGHQGDRAVGGAAGGALLGSLVGGAIGSSSNNWGTGAALGALAGGVGGAALGASTNTEKGWEYVVTADSGEQMVVVQTGPKFFPGTRVRIQIPLNGGRIRLVPSSKL